MPVQWRSTCAPKSDFLVEAHGLAVLFIHVSGHSRVEFQAVARERSSNAPSAASWIDKERLHMPLVDKHESQRVIIWIDGKPKRRFGEKAANQLVDREAILRRQKIMGSVNGASPNFDCALSIAGA